MKSRLKKSLMISSNFKRLTYFSADLLDVQHFFVNNGVFLRFRNLKGEVTFLIHSEFFQFIGFKNNELIFELSSQASELSGSKSQLLIKEWARLIRRIDKEVAALKEGYQKKILLKGIGYRLGLDIKNSKLLWFRLGYCHDIPLSIPKAISVTIGDDKASLVLTSQNKEVLGLFAEEICKLRKREVYKGKGVLINDPKKLKEFSFLIKEAKKS